jgi:hypothetical protein
VLTHNGGDRYIEPFWLIINEVVMVDYVFLAAPYPGAGAFNLHAKTLIIGYVILENLFSLAWSQDTQTVV